MKVANLPAEKSADNPVSAVSPALVVTTPDAIKAMVRQAVAEALAEVESNSGKFADRMILSEQELADQFGWQAHVLRDLRRSGGIAFCRLAGRRIGYDKKSVLEYLAKHREEARVQSDKPP